MGRLQTEATAGDGGNLGIPPPSENCFHKDAHNNNSRATTPESIEKASTASSSPNQQYPADIVPVFCRPCQIPNSNEDTAAAAALPDDPNHGKLQARFTITEPPFWISLHNATFDPMRWSIMNKGYYYEHYMMDAFAAILYNNDNDKQMRMIDVGGNVGFFSLFTAALASSPDIPIIIDAFEPNVVLAKSNAILRVARLESLDQDRI